MKKRPVSAGGAPTGSESDILDGLFALRVPGLRPYVSTAAYGVKMATGVVELYNRRNSVFRYCYTHTGIRMAGRGSQWLDVPAGSVVITPAFARYSLDMGKPEVPPRHVWVTLVWMEETPLWAMVQNRLGCARLLDPDRLIEAEMAAVVDLIRGIRDRDQAFWPVQHLGSRLVDVASRAVRIEEGLYRVDARVSSRRADPLVSRIMAYLRQHISEQFTVADIAGDLHASVSSIAHRYSAATGESPMQTLRRMRLEEAKGLIAQGIPIGDVALRMGFYDAHHFSRVFKRVEGIPPTGFLLRMTAGRRHPLD